MAALPNPLLAEFDAFLIETTAKTQRTTWMMRIEQVEKDELYAKPDPRAGTVYQVEKLSGGLAFEVWPRGPVAFSIGGLASLSRLPDELDADYGKNPISGMVFLRAMLR